MIQATASTNLLLQSMFSTPGPLCIGSFGIIFIHRNISKSPKTKIYIFHIWENNFPKSDKIFQLSSHCHCLSIDIYKTEHKLFTNSHLKKLKYSLSFKINGVEVEIVVVFFCFFCWLALWGWMLKGPVLNTRAYI